MKIWLMLSIGVFFVAQVEAASAGDGEAKYLQTCASCHGDSAQGNDALGSPALAAQQSSYLVRQYNNFASGLRGTHSDDKFGQQMVAMSKALTDANEIQKVAEYLSELPAVKQKLAEGDIENGYKYYQSCGSCHGPKANGNLALNTPSLVGLSADYIKRQHVNFNTGLRGTHADDRFGRQMAMMAGTMKDEKTLNDVIAYINSLSQ